MFSSDLHLIKLLCFISTLLVANGQHLDQFGRDLGAETTDVDAAAAQQSFNQWLALGAAANGVVDPPQQLASELLMTNDLLGPVDHQNNPNLNEQQHLQFNSRNGEHTSPGHYEFDVAPGMEPPTVRKPPYRQTSQTCPGSDLLGGFSPRDTLCGDLNQGRVPLNPIGQSVTDQAYPFEVIKNKTLQFLARALPVLKSEYESIPKVARYLPANYLLNPTSHDSPLGHGHFNSLNQKVSQMAPGDADARSLSVGPHEGENFNYQMPSSLDPNRKRRRRRSIASPDQTASTTAAHNQKQAAQPASHGTFKPRLPGNQQITVAEMMPNASLVVSSAHSAPGRIMQQQAKRSVTANNNIAPPRLSHFMMVTKDGFRPLSGAGGPLTLSSAIDDNKSAGTSASGNASRNSADHQHVVVGVSSRKHGLSEQTNTNRMQQDATDQSHSKQHSSGAQEFTVPRTSSQDNNNADDDDSVAMGRSATGNGGSSDQESAGSSSKQQQQSSSASNSKSNLSLQQQQQQQQQQGSTTSKRRMNCAELGGGAIASTVCQTAAALIEGDKAPAWVQVAKQLGSLYASGSSPDSFAASSWPLLGLLGGLGNSGAASGDQTDAKSSGGGTGSGSGGKLASGLSSAANIWNLVSPIANYLVGVSPTSGSGGESASVQTKQSNDHAVSSTNNHNDHKTGLIGSGNNNNGPLSASTLTKMALAGWATTALAGLAEYLVPSVFSSNSWSFARRKKPYDPSETFVDTPASLAAMSSHAAKMRSLVAPTSGAGSAPTPTGQANNKQPPTPCPSVEEYISPTFARNYQGAWKYVVQIPHEGYFTQTIQRSSCLRQKCEFTDGVCHEAPRWVSLLVAEIYYPNAVFSGSPASSTGTINSNSNNNNNNINLDNIQPQPQIEPYQMATAQSMNHLQQVALGHQQQPQQQMLVQQNQMKPAVSHDPLQMTDSFNTYNLNNNNNNLNSAAYLSAAASQLGLDPTNLIQMQQLADTYNYQLIQRTGMSHQQQQQQQSPLIRQHGHQALEARASHLPVANHNQYQAIINQQAQPRSQTSASTQQQQQRSNLPNVMNQQSPSDQTMDLIGSSSMSNSEYIRALAAETLRQNPHLTIDDLIKSLQVQTGARKKRDLSNVMSSQHQPRQQQQHPTSAASNQLQHRSIATAFDANGLNSMNDLGAAFSALVPQQQPQQSQTHQPQTYLNANSKQQQQHHLQLAAADNQAAATSATTPTTPTTPTNQHQSIGTNQQIALDLASNPSTGLPSNGGDLSNQQQRQQQQQMASSAVSNSGANGAINTMTNNNPGSNVQTECDGHDKIGCYVVRVYYDWFLVNGSCKCWRTNVLSNGQQQQQQQQSGSSANSFLRRIFTG